MSAQPAETTMPVEETNNEQHAKASADSANEAQAPAPITSTLIEFPGVSRNKPQWRKDLSERVREIQERRGRDGGTRETANVAQQQQHATQLGLVPQPNAPAVNPIVAAALKRLERARQPIARSRATMGGAATAVARVADEQYQLEEKRDLELGALMLPAPLTETDTEQLPEEKPAEAPRERTLVVVPPSPQQQSLPATPTQASMDEAQNAITQGLDAEAFADLDEAALDAAPAVEPYDDRAPVIKRLVGSFIDLLVVAFASSPFAAIIELTNGDWSDLRVASSMGGIFLTIMFLYLTASTALAGRTWGMSLLSIRAVDADSGLPPTTRQSIGRALLYMLSLASFGLGILYALFDAESRTAHDRLSGTAVVHE
ncbi:MAG TPA: RDD family protein [Pyrinomonadaceae bacterium]